MKKALATLCLIGSTLTLAACETAGTSEDVSYAKGRTAYYGNTDKADVAPAEEVFHKAQMK